MSHCCSEVVNQQRESCNYTCGLPIHSVVLHWCNRTSTTTRCFNRFLRTRRAATKSFIYQTFHKTILPPPLSTLHPLTILFYHHGCGLRTHSLRVRKWQETLRAAARGGNVTDVDWLKEEASPIQHIGSCEYVFIDLYANIGDSLANLSTPVCRKCTSLGRQDGFRRKGLLQLQ